MWSWWKGTNKWNEDYFYRHFEWEKSFWQSKLVFLSCNIFFCLAGIMFHHQCLSLSILYRYLCTWCPYLCGVYQRNIIIIIMPHFIYVSIMMYYPRYDIIACNHTILECFNCRFRGDINAFTKKVYRVNGFWNCFSFSFIAFFCYSYKCVSIIIR